MKTLFKVTFIKEDEYIIFIKARSVKEAERSAKLIYTGEVIKILSTEKVRL